MHCGFAMISVGCVRAKFAKHIAMLILVDACTSAIAWYFFGYSLSPSPDPAPTHRTTTELTCTITEFAAVRRSIVVVHRKLNEPVCPTCRYAIGFGDKTFPENMPGVNGGLSVNNAFIGTRCAVLLPLLNRDDACMHSVLRCIYCALLTLDAACRYFAMQNLPWNQYNLWFFQWSVRTCPARIRAVRSVPR